MAARFGIEDIVVEFGWLGLMELLIVLAFALGWGAVELYTLRLDERRAEEAKRAEAADASSDSQR